VRKAAVHLCLAIAGCLLADAGAALACGDKLLVLGRHVRSQRARGAIQRGSILVLLDQAGQLQAALRATDFGRDLELAGHRVRLVWSVRELGNEIGSGGYDIVIADIADVAALGPELAAAPGGPVLLPVVVNTTGDEWSEAAARFSCIRRSPSAGKHYLAVIEEALAQARVRDWK
jgi:hypothetical protein